MEGLVADASNRVGFGFVEPSDLILGNKMSKKANKTSSIQKPTHKVTLADLERHLFKACEILRGHTSVIGYMEPMFRMLCLKHLNDQFDREGQATPDAQSEGNKTDALTAQALTKSFLIPQEARWTTLRLHRTSLATKLNMAFAALEQANFQLTGVFTGFDFNSTVRQRPLSNSTLVNLVAHFDCLPLSHDAFDNPGVLGKACEYMFALFAERTGKSGSEFFTPPQVTKLMVDLLNPQEGMSCYDPCVGAGGSLVQSWVSARQSTGSGDDVKLVGQETNFSTWSLCKMNMLLNGIHDADIRMGCVLRKPMHISSSDTLERFDRIISVPPFSMSPPPQLEISFPERFHAFTGTKKADLMFVQHMISSLRPDGKLVVAVTQGVLFRGGKEQEIRRHIVSSRILEAVISLPPGLLYSTSIPICILVISKAKTRNRDSVQFINAGHNSGNLNAADITRILGLYETPKNLVGYSRNVPIDAIEAENYNLNVAHYIDSLDQSSDSLDVKDVWSTFRDFGTALSSWLSTGLDGVKPVYADDAISLSGKLPKGNSFLGRFGRTELDAARMRTENVSSSDSPFQLRFQDSIEVAIKSNAESGVAFVQTKPIKFDLLDEDYSIVIGPPSPEFVYESLISWGNLLSCERLVFEVNNAKSKKVRANGLTELGNFLFQTIRVSRKHSGEHQLDFEQVLGHVLVELSAQTGEGFTIESENNSKTTQWEQKVDSTCILASLEKRKEDKEAMQYFLHACRSNDTAAKYLSFYHVAEYYFDKDEELLEKLQARLASFQDHPMDSSDIRDVINLVRKSRGDERTSLRRVLVKQLNATTFQTELKERWRDDLVSYYLGNDGHWCDDGSTKIDFKGSGFYTTLAKRIYTCRNQIVHRKKVEGVTYNPFEDCASLAKEIPIIQTVATLILRGELER